MSNTDLTMKIEDNLRF